MIISFSGLDGSGKSTTSILISKKLKEKKFKVKRVYMGNYFLFGFIPNIARFVFSKKYKLNKKTNKPKNLLKLWMLVFFLDSFIYYLYLRIINLYYDFIVTDRYFLDKLVSLNYLGYSNNFYNKIFLSLLLRPDIHFYLYDNFNNLKNREIDDSHTIKFYKEMSLIFSFFLKKLNVTKIKTNNKKNTIKEIFNNKKLSVYLNKKY